MVWQLYVNAGLGRGTWGLGRGTWGLGNGTWGLGHGTRRTQREQREAEEGIGHGSRPARGGCVNSIPSSEFGKFSCISLRYSALSASSAFREIRLMAVHVESGAWNAGSGAWNAEDAEGAEGRGGRHWAWSRPSRVVSQYYRVLIRCCLHFSALRCVTLRSRRPLRSVRFA